MEDLCFENKEEFEKFIIEKDKIGVGTEGTCYRVDDYTLKIYIDLSNNFKEMYNDSYYLQFKNINIDNFHFIKNLVYLENKESKRLIGTISNYVDGLVLDYKILYNTNIDNIINGIINLTPSIKELSKQYICIGDAFIKNIIYNKDNFHFIDTASYYYSDEYPYYIYKYNVITVMKELIESATGSYENGLINKYLFKIDNRYNYNYDLELLLNPVDLLQNLKKTLEEYCNKEIVCFSDSQYILKRKLQCY